jgi:Putative transposase
MPRELSGSPPCERVSYPHPYVVISNARLIALDAAGVTFKWKDYRIKGRDWLKTMTLDGGEFIRRFLLCESASKFDPRRLMPITLI